MNIKALTIPLSEDIKALSVYWWQNNIAHKISEDQGQQVVWTSTDTFVQRLNSDYADFKSGRLNIELHKSASTDKKAPLLKFFNLILEYPVTLSLALLSVIGFMIVQFDQNLSVLKWLYIQGMADAELSQKLGLPQRISPQEFLAHGQYWRLVTPIFLHFSWIHIVFNMLWLWELGRRIEKQGGAIHFLSIVFFIGIASNLYQAASTPYNYFGGMSGVVYGLLGYCAIYTYILPGKALRLPKEYYVILLLSLVVGWLGLFDFLAQMANTAHTSGLIFGVIIGGLSAMANRFIWGEKAE